MRTSAREIRYSAYNTHAHTESKGQEKPARGRNARGASVVARTYKLVRRSGREGISAWTDFAWEKEESEGKQR